MSAISTIESLKPTQLRMLDLFAGAGGASAAMRDRGWDVVAVDNRPELEPTILADISTWRYSGPPVDLLWASPPCTEFAKDDKRCWYPLAKPPSLNLLAAALRLVCEVGPRWWLIENVRGARRWFEPVLGPPVLQAPPLYLWGRPPPGLLLPKLSAFKENISRRSSDPRLLRLSSDARRSQLRAIVPYEVSYAVAAACERAAPLLSSQGGMPQVRQSPERASANPQLDLKLVGSAISLEVRHGT